MGKLPLDRTGVLRTFLVEFAVTIVVDPFSGVEILPFSPLETVVGNLSDWS